MKNKWFLYLLISLLIIGVALYGLGSSINGSWRENILWLGYASLVAAGILTLSLIAAYGSEAHED